MMDSLTYQEVQSHLSNGERVIWAGRPKTGMRFDSGDILVIPFGLMFLGFSIFWEYSATSTGKAPIFFTLWGIPFILVGLHISIGRFFWDAWVRSGQIYALTNLRLIVLRQGSMQSSALNSLPQLNLTTSADGSGTINFSAPIATDDGFSKRPRNGSSFRFLENADEVYAKILKAQRDLARY